VRPDCGKKPGSPHRRPAPYQCLGEAAIRGIETLEAVAAPLPVAATFGREAGAELHRCEFRRTGIGYCGIGPRLSWLAYTFETAPRHRLLVHARGDGRFR
jgi:hypothetical protein